MASRNLPPSFFNAHYHAQVKSSSSYASPGELYSETAGYPGLHHLAAHHASSSPDPWQYAAQVTRITLTYILSYILKSSLLPSLTVCDPAFIVRVKNRLS